MVRQRMRRPALAGAGVGGRAKPPRRTKPGRVRYEVDDRGHNLSTPSIWYNETAGNWFIAVLIVALWVAEAIAWNVAG